MPSKKSPGTYQTYLLRLRRVPSANEHTAERPTAEQATWEATSVGQWQLILVHPYTGARRTFDSIEALSLFLQEQMAE